MTRAAALLSLTTLVLLIAAPEAAAQLSYVSIDSLSTISENFDLMGSDNIAALPTGWRIGVSAEFITAKSSTTKSAGTSGVGALTSNSDGGFYNFANGDNDTSTDRSVGFLTDFSSTQNKYLHLALFNNTGSPITELHLSYDIEKYRSGVRSSDVKFFYGFDGTTWTEIVDAAQHYDADSTVAVTNPPTTINKSTSLASLNIADQTNFFIRWQYTTSSFNGCQALGIDNFQLSFQQADLRWDGAPGASWDTASANWKNSSAAHVAWSDGMPNNASFIDGGANVATAVTLSSPRRAGRLTFDAGSKSYSLSGSSLELSGAGGIGILGKSNALIQSAVHLTSSQTWDISSTLTLSGSLSIDSNLTLTKKGSGTVSLSGPQIMSADSQMKVIEGTLRLGANLGNAAILRISGNANATDANVILDSDQDVAELFLSTTDSGRQGLNLSSPAAAGAFRSLRIHASDLTSGKSTLYAAIQQARLTPGDGIFDSSLAAHPGSALGLAIQSDHILIRPTRIGDINLDGIVTISDFIDLSSNFGRSNVIWQEGDLNYDGSVTISDFIDLASNFGSSYAGQPVPISAADQLALDSFAAAHGMAIPEPASISLLLFISLATRRRRRLQFAK